VVALADFDHPVIEPDRVYCTLRVPFFTSAPICVSLLRNRAVARVEARLHFARGVH
jgi:hypothetical protein